MILSPLCTTEILTRYDAFAHNPRIEPVLTDTVLGIAAMGDWVRWRLELIAVAFIEATVRRYGFSVSRRDL